MLKFEVDKIEDVPESIRDQYTEKDGKFVLQVEGAESAASVHGLKSAMLKERDNRKAYERFGSPDDIEVKFATLEADLAAAGRKQPKSQSDDDHKAILDQMKLDHAKEREADALKLQKERANLARKSLETHLAKLNVFPDDLEYLSDKAKSRIDFNDDGSLRILSDDGVTPMVGKGRDGGATLEDLAGKIVSAHPRCVEDQGKGGGGKPLNSSSGGKPSPTTDSGYGGTKAERTAAINAKLGDKLAQFNQ